MTPGTEDAKPRSFVVSGGGAGIGAAIVELLLRSGARGLSVDLREPASPQDGAEFVQADVTSSDDWGSVAERIGALHGGLDMLIHAAGIQHSGPLDDLDERAAQKVLAVNLLGPMLGSKALLPALRIRKGAIVTFGSALGLVGAKDQSVYSASKGGVIALTRSLAAELGPDGIRVNCICPGPVGTELFWQNARRTAGEDGLTDAQLAAPFADKTVLGRLAEPGEIAEAAVFFASRAASYITGAVVPVDGGKTAI